MDLQIYQQIYPAIDADLLLRAMGVGSATASSIAAQFGSPPIHELAASLGIRVVREMHEKGIVGSVIIRAAYEPDPPTIRIFTDALEVTRALLAGMQMDELAAQAESILIAHEIFHHLERAKSIGSPLPEVSAHQFTKELLKLHWTPALLDLDESSRLSFLRSCLAADQ